MQKHLQSILAISALMVLTLSPCTRAAGISEKHGNIEISREFIYEQASFPQCHASTIAEVAPGKLVAAWFGGSRERAPDVGIWVSRNDGNGWSACLEVANGIQPDGTRLPTWNPVLFQPPGGRLHLFYKVGPSPSKWWGMLLRSSDGGITWERPQRMSEGFLGPIKNKPVVLSDGSWLLPSSTEGNKDGWRIHFEISTDSGRTWRIAGPVAKDPGFDAIQPSVLIHRDGRLQALARTKQGVIATTWSSDNGSSWSPLEKTELPNPNSGTDAVTLADGRHLLVYNHSKNRLLTPTKGDRFPLDIAVSNDGVKWRRVHTLESEPHSAGYAYPAVIQTSDGLVHITYTWHRTRIRHVVIDPRKCP